MRISQVLFAVMITLGCGPKSAGQSCNESKECAKGLVCVANLCADAVKVTRQRATRVQGLVEAHQMREQGGDCPETSKGVPEAASILDPWGNPFDLKCPGKNALVAVVSRGPDGEPDTGDEISTDDE
jgi:hypothetical protein